MKIAYQLVSIPAVLRDWTDGLIYHNEKHLGLVNIADTLYNADVPATMLKAEYQQLHNEYSQDFWHLVLEDMHALDSQLTSQNVGQLIEDYNEMLNNN